MRTALTVATGLAQVGEFSFILALAAQQLELIPTEVYSILVICCMASIVLNPSLVRQVPGMEKYLRRHPRLWHILSWRADHKAMKGNQLAEAVLSAEEEGLGRAIVIGYGPSGRQVAAALAERGLTPVIIDMNVDTVNDLTSQGLHAVFGDSSQSDVLHAAGVEKARYLVATIPDISTTIASVSTAIEMNPELRILVRARFLNDKPLLCSLGVSAIAFEEEEVAKTLAGLIAEDLENEVAGDAVCELPENPAPEAG